MKKHFIFCILLMVVGMVLPSPMLHAQQPPTIPVPKPNPVLDMLLWAGDLFPFPDWMLNVHTLPRNVSITWTTDARYTGVAFFYQDYTTPFDETPEQLSARIDDTWLTTAMQDYGKWREEERCVVSETVVIEMITTENDQRFMVRVWFWYEDGWFTEFFAAYELNSAEALETLETIAETKFGDAARCE